MRLLSLTLGSLILFLSSSSQAEMTCEQQLKQLRSRKVSKQIRVLSVTIDNKEDQKSLDNLSRRAFKDALEKSEAQDDIEGVEVLSHRLVEKTAPENTLGYRIYVDAGDEYRFLYYFSAKGDLLYWHWTQEVSTSEYVCEGYARN